MPLEPPHVPPQERPAPPAQRRRAQGPGPVGPVRVRPRRRGRPRQDPPLGRRRVRLPACRPRRRPQKKRIEDAYALGEGLGRAVWCCDQAGPFQTVPQPGQSWQPEGEPARQPHEYVRNGTAKVLTLFHPASGRVRVEGATSCPNTVLHPWLKRELTAVLAELPAPPPTADSSRTAWARWQAGLT